MARRAQRLEEETCGENARHDGREGIHGYALVLCSGASRGETNADEYSPSTVAPQVSETYSEYESVDEEEAAAEEAKTATKGKRASAAKLKKGSDDKDGTPKSKPVARSNSVKKNAGTKPSAQGSLKDFFGKPKK